MNNREKQAILRKAQIKETCLSLFIQHKIDGIAIKDISEASNISVGLLFHYYQDKDEIYSQLLDEAIIKIYDLFTPDASYTTPLSIFENITSNILSFISDEHNAKLYILFYDAYCAFNKGYTNYIKLNDFNTRISTLNSLIVLGQQLNEFIDGNSKTLISLYLSLLYGSAIHYINGNIELPSVSEILRIIKK